MKGGVFSTTVRVRRLRHGTQPLAVLVDVSVILAAVGASSQASGDARRRPNRARGRGGFSVCAKAKLLDSAITAASPMVAVLIAILPSLLETRSGRLLTFPIETLKTLLTTVTPS